MHIPPTIHQPPAYRQQASSSRIKLTDAPLRHTVHLFRRTKKGRLVKQKERAQPASTIQNQSRAWKMARSQMKHTTTAMA